MRMLNKGPMAANEERAAVNATAAELLSGGFVLQLEGACLVHKDRLQRALSDVFDHGATEARVRSIAADISSALVIVQTVHEDLRAFVTEMNRALDALDKRLGAVEIFAEGR